MLSVTEVTCYSIKKCKLKYFCDSCDKDLSELRVPDLKILISFLYVGVGNLKNNQSTPRPDEFLTNEMYEL